MSKNSFPVVRGWRPSDFAIGLVLALIIFVSTSSDAWAQDVPSPTAISLKGVTDFFMPYLSTLVGAAVTAVLAFASNAIYKWTGYQVEARHREALHSAAMTAAASIWAKADAKIASMSIDPKSMLIKAGVDWVLTVGAPKAVETFKLSPEQVADLIASKIGTLQVQAAAAPAPAPAA